MTIPNSSDFMRNAGWRGLFGLSVCGQLLVAHAALACPGCFSQTNPGVLDTYYLTAAFMTLLPLIIVGSIGAWVYRRQRSTHQP